MGEVCTVSATIREKTLREGALVERSRVVALLHQHAALISDKLTDEVSKSAIVKVILFEVGLIETGLTLFEAITDVLGNPVEMPTRPACYNENCQLHTL